MGGISKYNISILKNYKNDFSNERNNFISSSYNTFLTSYLGACSDSIVQTMYNKLKGNYEAINNKYNAIDRWWSNYLNDVEGLENALSNSAGIGCIREAALSSYVNSIIIELSDYNPDFAQFGYKGVNLQQFQIQSAVGVMAVGKSNLEFSKNMSKNIMNAITKVGTSFVGNAKNVWNSAKSVMSNFLLPDVEMLSKSVKNMMSLTGALVGVTTQTVANEVKDFKQNVIDTAWKIAELKIALEMDNVNAIISKITGNEYELKSKEILAGMTEHEIETYVKFLQVESMVTTGVVSLAEGAVNVVEWIGDTSNIFTSACVTPFTGIYDGGQAIYGLITGNEWESATKKMWDDTMADVSEKHVESAFNWFYDSTDYEDFAKALTGSGFNTARQVGKGLGEAVGIVTITLLTCGAGAGVAAGGGTAASVGVTAGQTATVAGISGFGKGAEKSWNEGANLFEGLTYATGTGLWEGFQYYIGAKIGQCTKFLPKVTNGSSNVVLPSLSQKLKNSALKVLLDTIDSGVEGFVQPALDLIYKDSYIDEKGNEIKFTENESKVLQLLINYAESFEANGGWANVGTNAAMGTIGSILGEAMDLKKLLQDRKVMTVDDLDLTAGIFRKVDAEYSVDDAKLTSQEKAQLLNLERILKNDSDPAAVDLLINSLKVSMLEGDNVATKRIMQTLYKVKIYNPSFKLSVCADGADKWDADVSTIYLGTNSGRAVPLHELGHALFTMVLGGKLPNDWSNIMARARFNTSNGRQLDDAIFQINNVVQNNWTKAENKFYSQFKDNEEFMKYFQELKKGYGNQMKKISIGYILSKFGTIGEKIANLTKQVTAHDLAVNNIESQIFRIATKIGENDVYECAISDVIDAMFLGKSIDINGKSIGINGVNLNQIAFTHGEEYYQDAGAWAEWNAFHEIIANFTTMKLLQPGSEQWISYIFGEELYNVLNDIFNQFIQF